MVPVARLRCTGFMDDMMMIAFTECPSPLGNLLLAATTRGLCGLYFEEHRHFKGTQGWMRDDGHDHLQRAVTQLHEYFDHRRTSFALALDLQGTQFQRAVWTQLLSLPFGSTATYQTIAERVSSSRAVRAAGAAIGRNPVSIIVPCHRVLGASGGLTGYAGGLERKQLLLSLEGINR